MDDSQYNGYATAIQAASALANSVGTAYVNKSARNENRRIREWNEKMMDKQNAYNTSMWNATNEYNLSMWEKNNEYNNAANTRQRMLDAGINPLSADWSNSTASAVSASNPTSSNVNGVPVTNIDNPISSAIDAALSVASLRKLQSETKTENQLRAERLEQLKQQNEQIRKTIQSTELSIQSQEIINKYLDAKESAAAEQAQEQVKLTKSQREQVDTSIKELQYRIDKMLPEEFKSLVKNNSLLDQKILSEKKNREHIDKMMDMIDVEIKKLVVETGIAENDLYYYLTNHMSNGFMGTGLSLNNALLGLEGIAKPFLKKKNNGGAR